MTDANREEALGKLIADYLQATQQGESPNREELLAAHPELADELRSFFANHDRMRAEAGVGFDEATLPPESSSASAEPTVGERVRYFGDYELLEEIARGGMGVVYKARQVNLNRIVAVKMILAGQFAGEDDVRRFHAEAEAAANLDHPNIVPIFEVGEHKGQHYFSMGYVEGQSLADRIAEGPFPPEEAATLVKTLAEAIQYAHSKGVIHRDLKPANVLLEAKAEAEALPKITDFGLAKKVEENFGLTATGQILGTPAYMPPEQAAGRIGEVTETADVYSLGAILYCLLVGRPPFQAANVLETLQQVLADEPAAPRQLNPAVPLDLETIALECLQKDRRKRYGSARELVDELDRFLRGEPIHARPIGRVERSWRWCSRNPVIAGLVALVAVSLLVGTAVSSWFAIEATVQRNFAQNEKTEADRQRLTADKSAQAAGRAKTKAENLAKDLAENVKQKDAALRLAQQREREAQQHEREAQQHERGAQWNLYVARLFPMKAAWEKRRYGELEQLLADSKPKEGEPDFRGWEWYYFQDQCRLASRQLQGDRVGVSRWCPTTGKLAVTVDGNVVQIRDSSGEKVERTLPIHKGGIRDLCWSPDGTRLAVADGSRVAIWAVETGELLHELDTGYKEHRTVAWSADGEKLGVCGGETTGAIRIWKTQDWKLLQTLDASRESYISYVRDIDWHPDNKRLASAHRHGYARVWDTETGQRLWTKQTGDAGGVPLSAVGWSPDGNMLATARSNGLTVFDEAGNTVDFVKANLEEGEVAWSPDGKSVAGAGKGQTVVVWSRDTKEVRFHSVHGKEIHFLDWSPDGKRLLVGGSRVTRIISIGQEDIRARKQMFPGKLSHPKDVHWSPDGSLLMCLHRGGTSFCDPDSAEVLKTFRNGWSSAWRPDSKMACSLTSSTGLIHVYDTSDPRNIQWTRNVELGKDSWSHLGFSHDGKFVAIGGFNNTGTEVWAASTWKRIAVVDREVCWSLKWSPTRSLLATTGVPSVKVWSPSEKLLWPVPGGSRSELAWNPDGRFLAAGAGGRLALFRAADGKLIRAAGAHKGAVTTVAWSRDGRRIATGGTDGTIALWDAATVTKLMTLECGSPVTHVDWHPNSRRMVCLCEDGTIRIWGSPQMEGLPKSAAQLETGLLASTPTVEEEFTEEEPQLTAAIEAQPKDARTWQTRGRFYYQHQQWAKAAADYEQALALKAPGIGYRWMAAHMQLMAGNSNAYAEHCRDIARKISRYKNPPFIFARVCALAPIEDMDYDPLLAAARLSAKHNPDKSWMASAPGPILYRMGRYEEALDVLRKVDERSQAHHHKAVNHFWQALTYHQLGQAELAGRALANGIELSRPWMPGPNIKLRGHLNQFVECHLLRREAERLLRGKRTSNQGDEEDND